MNQEIKEFAALVTATLEPVRVQEEAAPFVLVPSGYQIQSVENTLQHPCRPRGTVTLFTVTDFIEVVRQQMTERTRIYVDPASMQVTAVLNAGSWGDDRIVLKRRHSRHFTLLQGAIQRAKSQKGLIEFFEDFSYLVKHPEAAKLIEVARAFRATQNVRVVSDLNMANGDVEFTYVKTTEAGTNSAKGKFLMPEEIIFGLPVYEGDKEESIGVRIRYAINEGGALSFSLDFRLLHIIEERLASELLTYLESQIGRTVYFGTPAEPICA
jgi:uncharacterized protein YfdQ (DUF2303 family)